MRSRGLNRVLKTFFVSMPLLMVACDPGVTIHQVKSSDDARGANPTTTPSVVVKIKPTRQLIGEKFYYPEVEVTNTSGSPIIITNVELAAGNKTYANTPPRPETYPLTIPLGDTGTLEVLFRLDHDLYETFQGPVELRVHYLADGKLQVIRTGVTRD
jgi:hypothetical protein